jgi:hypothetical protein
MHACQPTPPGFAEWIARNPPPALLQASLCTAAPTQIVVKINCQMVRERNSDR